MEYNLRDDAEVFTAQIESKLRFHLDVDLSYIWRSDLVVKLVLRNLTQSSKEVVFAPLRLIF